MNGRSVALRLIDDGLAVQEGERLVVLADPSVDSRLLSEVAATAEARGSLVQVVQLPFIDATPHGYLTWDVPQSIPLSMFDGVDAVLVIMRSLIALTPVVARARQAGTRFLFIPADLDVHRRSVMMEPLEVLRQRGEAITKVLAGGSRLRITSREGTDLAVSGYGMISFDDARSHHRGDLDFVPGGMWNVVPVDGAVSGSAVLPATVHPVGIVRHPIRLTWEDSHLVAVEGGFEARQWEEWLGRFTSSDVRTFSHLSGGLACEARIIGHDWEDLITLGGVVVSGGENMLYGGTISSPGHFDAVIPAASIEVDGAPLLVDGRYSVDVAPKLG